MMEPEIIHNYDEAENAFKTTSGPVVLISAPEAAASLGVLGFLEMIAAAASEYSDIEYTAILDCGDQAGLAMNALRLGAKDICVNLPTEVRTKIEEMAAQSGARVHIRPSN